MKQGIKVFVHGNGLHCHAILEEIPARMSERGRLGHVLVSIPADCGITKYTPNGKRFFWVEKKNCIEVAQDPT